MTSLLACLERFEIQNENTVEQTIVIEGTITNQPGPQKIILSYNQSIDNTGKQFVNNAKVEVEDDLGNTYLFEQSNEGDYQSHPDFTGIVGRSYQLIITLANGEILASKSEKLNPVAEIKNLKAEGVDVPVFNENTNETEFVRNANILLAFNSAPNETGYYRWSFSDETYVLISWKLPSGVLGIPGKCWAHNRQARLNTISVGETNSSGRAFINKNILQISDRTKIHHSYAITVNQYSLNKDAYDYYNTVKQGLERSGTIFDPLPASTPGNIVYMDNPAKQVLGYFSASAVSQKMIHFNSYTLEIPLSGLGLCSSEEASTNWCQNCLRYNRSEEVDTVRPNYWRY